jgi:hypothetical protein
MAASGDVDGLAGGHRASGARHPAAYESYFSRRYLGDSGTRV